MTIKEFADKYRLRLERHEDGESIIPGKYGHIYEHGETELGLLFMPGQPRLWAHARRKLDASRFVIWQDGDEEGSALFDAKNVTQASLALKVIGAKRKRTLTPEQREALIARLKKARAASAIAA
jgi:hypothetical protein